MPDLYYLMDGRAFHDVEEATVLDTGTAQAMCDQANSDEFGECAVVNENMEVMWEWYKGDGKWRMPA